VDAVIFISDPWDFGTECGVGPFKGKVVERTASAILIALDSPLVYRSNTLLGVIALPRHANQFEIGGSQATAVNMLLTASASVGLLAKPLPSNSLSAVGSLKLS
jgi:hypothetical protein